MSQLSTKDEDNDDSDDNNEEYSTNTIRKRQLSTPSTPDVIAKKIRLKDNDNENQKGDDQIPEYLQSTNKIFDQIITDHTMNSAISIVKEDLRQISILKHKIADMKLSKKLWETYLKSGTGQWETQESNKTNVDRRMWPLQVKKMVLSKKSKTIDTSEGSPNEQKIYEITVYEHLKELNDIIEQYQNELDRMKNTLMYYTDDIEKRIDTFVQQHGIRLLELKFNYKIAILEYDYDVELLEREYLRLQTYRLSSKIIEIVDNICFVIKMFHI